MSTDMSHMVRRAVIVGAGRVEVKSAPRVPLDATEVRVAIAYAGICGSDLHVIDDPDKFGAPVPSGEVVPGHEQSGVVSEIGHAVTRLEVGQHVCVLPRTPCGQCRMCRLGNMTRCLAMLRPRTGGWAGEMVVDERLVIEVPEQLPLELAAMAEPMACVLRAVDRARITAGSTALVIGAGPMGLLLSRVLPHCGITKVLVSEPDPQRRQLAAAAGALTVDPTADDVVGWVRDNTDGHGVSYAFEAVGAAKTFEQAVECCDVGATVVVVGVAAPAERASLSPHTVFAKELTIVGAWGVETTFPRALEWLLRLRPTDVITAVFPLAQANAAVQRARSGSDGKVLIAPGD